MLYGVMEDKGSSVREALGIEGGVTGISPSELQVPNGSAKIMNEIEAVSHKHVRHTRLQYIFRRKNAPPGVSGDRCCGFSRIMYFIVASFTHDNERYMH
jgi:hypothetical protein